MRALRDRRTWRGKPRSTCSCTTRTAMGQTTDLGTFEFLCANCHSQTDTYGGRNGNRKPERHLKLVPRVAESDEEEVG